MDGRQRSDVARRPHRHGGRAGGRGEPGTRCGLHGRDGLRLSSRSRSGKVARTRLPRPSPAANATARSRTRSVRPAGERAVDMAAPRVGLSCCEQTPIVRVSMIDRLIIMGYVEPRTCSSSPGITVRKLLAFPKHVEMSRAISTTQHVGEAPSFLGSRKKKRWQCGRVGETRSGRQRHYCCCVASVSSWASPSLIYY